MSAEVNNKLKMIETAVEGIIDRINRLEKILREFDDSCKGLMHLPLSFMTFLKSC